MWSFADAAFAALALQMREYLRTKDGDIHTVHGVVVRDALSGNGDVQATITIQPGGARQPTTSR